MCQSLVFSLVSLQSVPLHYVLILGSWQLSSHSAATPHPYHAIKGIHKEEAALCQFIPEQSTSNLIDGVEMVGYGSIQIGGTQVHWT